MTEYDDTKPAETEADTDFETEAEHQTPTDATSMTSGIAAPPSHLLDSEDGGSDWDAENFVAPTLEDMPTEGPGSPGYDVYAPENAKWENPEQADEPAEDSDHDDEDVESALSAETADGPGDTPVDQLPESDVDPNEELADDYPDLEPRGDDVADTKDDA